MLKNAKIFATQGHLCLVYWAPFIGEHLYKLILYIYIYIYIWQKTPDFDTSPISQHQAFVCVCVCVCSMQEKHRTPSVRVCAALERSRCPSERDSPKWAAKFFHTLFFWRKPATTPKKNALTPHALKTLTKKMGAPVSSKIENLGDTPRPLQRDDPILGTPTCFPIP